MKAMTTILLSALLAAGLGGCGKEHTPLTGDDFPAPLLDAAIVGAETVRLDWTGGGSPEYFRIYLGGYAWDEEMGIVEADTLIDSTDAPPHDIVVEGLTEYQEALGDTLYRFMFFRVAPFGGDEEGLRSPRAFPHR